MKPAFLRSPFSTLITLLTGLIVLLGYFLDFEPLREWRFRFLQWAILLAAVALFLGVFNLLRVHWGRLSESPSKAVYSLTFLGGFVSAVLMAGWLGIQHSLTRAVVDYVILPIEASLFVIILVTLLYALTRLLQHRLSVFSFVFLVTVLLSLIASIPLLGIEIPLLHGRDSLFSIALRILGTAGVRGLLIGVALGSVVTGIRVLFGLERPHGD
ncbi:MAG: hypothetical protein DDG59_01565 [Anaerolineae bacterium]|jgi:hypothetical protein|nr:MAG: hypothetical protein DDG59_01565 [Anaerolineae bacterium]